LPEHPEWQDDTFQPDRILADGDRLTLGPALTLQVLHTPGHASNHLCFHWLEQALLFTGDHVMQGSTVVINPPDGNMAAYLASLRRLQALAEPRPAGLDAEPAHGPLQWLAPGHGFLIPDPGRALRVLIRHRLNREARVLSALADLGPCSAEALLPRVYDDVPPARHPVALRSLRAHLLHLREQGRVGRVDGAWCSLPAG
jgi:glyoxylase-like metal-dependent hydrolase (beta-lactamase superfamily II)